MKRLKLFFACLLMAVLSIGQVWGADATCTLTNANIVAGSGGTSYGNASATDGCGKTWNAYAIKNHHSTATSSYKYWQIKKYASNTAYYIQVPTMPGKITSIALTVSSTQKPMTDGQNNTTLYFSASSSTSAAGAGVASATGASSVTIDCSALNLTTGYITASGAVRIWDVEVTYTAGGCSSEVTITKGAENHGTYTLSDTKVCADGDGGEITISNISPADGYEFDEITTSASGTVDNDLKKVTGIKAATTITVKFKAIPQYTVTWNNSGVTSTSQVYKGEKPEFPATPVACDATSTTFIGWATEAWTGKIANLDDKTVYTSADAMPAVSAAVTYYAVFAKVAGQSGWIETPIGDLTSTDVFVFAGGTYAMTNDNGTSSAPATSAITIADGKITSAVADNLKWNISGNATNGYTFYPNGTDESWLYCSTTDATGSNNNMRVGTGARKAFEFEGSYLKTKDSNTARYLSIYNNADFRGYVNTNLAIEAKFYKYSAGSASDYMTTCAAPTCENLGTPVVNVTNKTYNSARLTWAAVTNADKYLVKFNGVDQTATSNLYFDATDLEAEETYTYQVKALAAANQDDWCDGEFSAEANFTTGAAPKATLTLMNLGEEHASSGAEYAVGTAVTLPTTAATCSKTFVGWSDKEENIAAGDVMTQITLNQDTTLYAVYADVAAGPTTNIAYSTNTTTNMTGGNDAALLGLNNEEWSVVGAKGDNNNFPGLNKAGDIRLYYAATGSNTITITAPQTIASIALTYNTGYDNASIEVGGNVVALVDGVYPINATSFVIGNANTSNVQVQIKNIAVNFPGAQSNWATTCADPLDNPTFSLDPEVAPIAGEYKEAINVVITNNAGEGTIYYTTNGQNPTSASTEYTEPIVLNTCGTKTIKAIVISDNNQSEVVSATYEMAIPIPSVSAEDPYTEADAVAVINSGCYNDEDVWVTGTVASNGAAWYQNSGTYTITLENGFKFYYFYEGANEQAFTTNYIAAGDVLVAKGKLEKSGDTYRLAQGCYLVSRTPAQKTPIESDIDNPITVAAALNYIDNAATYELTNVYVKGVASADPDNQGTFNIHDANVDNTFQIYRGVLSAALIAAGEEVEENDTIIAFGELKKYYSTYEMAEGGEIVVVKKYNAPVVNVESVDMTESSASVEVGETVTLHAAVNPDNATDQAIVWSVQSGSDYASVDENGVVTGTAEGTAVIRAAAHEDESIYAECTVTVTSSSIPENTDIITAAKIGVEGNSYVAWENKTGFGTSSVYAGNSTNGTGDNTGALQLRYNTTESKQSGIVLTSSNGLVLKGLSVTVKSGSNTLNVYAKNTTYAGYSDLYSDDEDVRGKLIGTVSETGAMTLAAGVSYDDNYQFIGLRSANGALYLTDITITWGNAVTPPTPDYTRGVTNGNYGTICLPQAGTISGATLYDLESYENGLIYCLEVTDGIMEAGKPYIFKATSNLLEVTYSSADVVAAGHANGLYGFYDLNDEDAKKNLDQDGTNYILYQNQYWLVNSDAYIVNYRAYIKLGEIGTDVPNQQNGAPRRRIAMTVNGTNTATGIDEITNEQSQMTNKVIIDGRLFIIRGEKMYNANGQLVK